MEYPDNFDTPAFPAGKRIAVSRLFAILTSGLFVAILGVCGLLMWTTRSATVDPFIISVDKITGAWSVVGHSHGRIEYSASRTMQESVIANFARDWFTVGTDSENNALWQTCDRERVCMSDNAPAHTDGVCALYCAAGDDVFNRFLYNVVPAWAEIAANGGRVSLNMAYLQITPIGAITDVGGTWQISATVSTPDGDMQIIAFAKVARLESRYPRTLGYYIADFNTYRIN